MTANIRYMMVSEDPYESRQRRARGIKLGDPLQQNDGEILPEIVLVIVGGGHSMD
jgi:hypothetical protein